MRKIDFNQNWTFQKLSDDYHDSFSADNEGKTICLPHDAMQEGKRSPAHPSGSAGAYFPGGSYRYDKEFMCDASPRHRMLWFDGIYKNAKIYVNGHKVAENSYGYLPFHVNLDSYLSLGYKNTVTVFCENLNQPDSRWYTGAGIYRPVWLWEQDTDACFADSSSVECVSPLNTHITTLSYSPAVIRVEAPAGAVVKLYDCDGRIQAQGITRIHDDKKAAVGIVDLEVAHAHLWCDDNPYLYTVKIGTAGDVFTIPYGIRVIQWNSHGLFINGKETLLRGGCIHHDHGILGAAAYPLSDYRRALILKKAGYNAVRSAHNPASTAFLEACDQLGLYVMDESWDMWYKHKSKFDYASDFKDNYVRDLETIVNRDYNHPSVIMYSIGNEISEPARPEGVRLAHEMAEFLRSHDATRPVTAGLNLMIIANAAKGKNMYKDEGGLSNNSQSDMGGMNSTLFNLITSAVGTGMNKSANSRAADRAVSPVMDTLDICGYNYASGRYAIDEKKHPERIIVGSETFPQDIAKNWALVNKIPNIVGDFMWTAWDYIGEAGLGTWAFTRDGKGFNKPYPWLLADTGAIDILGNPTGELFWTQAVWGKLDKPTIAVQPMNHASQPYKGVWRGTNAIPSWSWKGCEGKRCIVEVYFDCAKVDMVLNGRKIASKKPRQCRTLFTMKYVPGTLEAIAYDSSGAEISRSQLSSARGEEIFIREEELSIPNPCISTPNDRGSDEGTQSLGEQIRYFDILIGDGQNVESNCDKDVEITVLGGELLAFGSSQPRTSEEFTAGHYRTYYGRSLAVVKAQRDAHINVQASVVADSKSFKI
ncbi:glycoside hydrolase family 2 TIM barrel-domain containing protein [Alloscardovia venturai]|uniref:Glycoside hydrolase family 2 TIM barrel-domain containing protein n=1 Tax=Alloscardovia venturai TaxID=1769421 RepID=A0ABW2Y681_9BIFI